MSSLVLKNFSQRTRELAPGFVVSSVVAAAACFLSEHYGAPVMLFALLLGMSVNFLAAESKCKVGIEFTARSVLRMGIALLGMRITLGQITALALSAAFPNHPQKEKATLFTVIGVSALSTFAMIVYPMIAKWLELSPQAAGVFLGATIHDVAQVVGAGYSMSTQTGDTATVVKLMRVAMLLPVIVCAAMITRIQGADSTGERPPLLPWFAVGFLLLACINSTGWVPAMVQNGINDLSRWFLVIAISALGMKTQLKELASVGIKPILLMIGESIFLVVLVLGLMRLWF